MMTCKECRGKLTVLRRCRQIHMQCEKCGRVFPIHEVADQLDPKTEAILERYPTIIYD